MHWGIEPSRKGKDGGMRMGRMGQKGCSLNHKKRLGKVDCGERVNFGVLRKEIREVGWIWNWLYKVWETQKGVGGWNLEEIGATGA